MNTVAPNNFSVKPNTNYFEFIPSGIDNCDFVLFYNLLCFEIGLEDIKNRLASETDPEQIERTKEELLESTKFYECHLSNFN